MMRATVLARSALGAACCAAACWAAACDAPAPRPPQAVLDIAGLLGGSDTLHARAVEPRSFTFPADHDAHPEFRSEWWYFTGTLDATDGREFGYQLTFFRSALTDSATFARLPDPRSGWRTRHAWMAHFAVTDARTGDFHRAERFARSIAGLAGVRSRPLRVHVHEWSAASIDSGTFPLRLHASTDSFGIDLVLGRGKPVVLQGDDGLSPKSEEPGNASYYYSLTRMPTHGTVRIDGITFDVEGASWLDREWSTSALSPHLVGWDWLALQLDDSTEVMMYRLRRRDGTPDPFSAATFVERNGMARTLDAHEFSMTPVSEWTTQDGVAYPVAWRVSIPRLDLGLDVEAAVEDQELDLSVRYWEGMVRVRGTRAGVAVHGRGYLEMTGYADPGGEVRR